MTVLPQLETDDTIVAFDDERERHRVASVTLTSTDGDTQWGEFLSHDDVVALHFWTGELLRQMHT